MSNYSDSEHSDNASIIWVDSSYARPASHRSLPAPAQSSSSVVAPPRDTAYASSVSEAPARSVARESSVYTTAPSSVYTAPMSSSDVAPSPIPASPAASTAAASTAAPTAAFIGPPPDSIASSVQGMTFATWEEAEEFVAGAAEDADFAVARRRSRKRDLAIPGGWKLRDLECYMGRKWISKGQHERQCTGKRCECPWKAILSYTEDGSWSVTIKNDNHNHARQMGHDIPANRRRHRNDTVRRRTIELSNAFHAPATKVAEQVARDLGVSITPRDVQNIKDAEAVKNRENFTATQCFYKIMMSDEGEDAPILAHQLDADDRPNYIFFSFKSCMDMWRANPEVISFDNTYKTNRFEMPLMQVTGVTGLNTTFNIAWCLMRGEKTEDYEWALTRLDEMLEKHEVPLPNVIVSDYDKAFRGALQTVWPDVPSQLCVWHINKNVQYHISVKWSGSLDGTRLGRMTGGRGSQRRDADSINTRNDDDDNDETETSSNWWEDNADGCIDAWKSVVNAPDEETFLSLYARMKAQFSEQTDIINYLETTYLPRRELFAHYAIKQHQNFGIKSTSRTESAHAALKAQLTNRRASLDVLLRAIKDMLRQQTLRYSRRRDAERGKDIMECREEKNKIWRELLRKVSHHAFKLMLTQYKIAAEVVERPGSRDMTCHEEYMKQFGLPCWHFIYGLLMAPQPRPIPLAMVHEHWHLWPRTALPEGEDEDDGFSHLRIIQDPAVRAIRGSRKTKKRTRSHDEMHERRTPRTTLETIEEEPESSEVLVPMTPPPGDSREVIDLTEHAHDDAEYEDAEYDDIFDEELRDQELRDQELRDEELEREMANEEAELMREVKAMLARARDINAPNAEDINAADNAADNAAEDINALNAEDAALQRAIEEENRVRSTGDRQELEQERPRRKRAVFTCTSCGQKGHTRRSRSCPNKQRS